jgi:hypothetical protein
LRGSRIGGTERVRVLAGFVRIAILMRGGDLKLEITRCSSGLLEPFVSPA